VAAVSHTTHDEPSPFVGVELGAVERGDEVVVLEVGAVRFQMVLPGCGRGSALKLDGR
jgi:hypothetical protein